jgi:thiamine-phosphate pyrophosphorylase
VPDIRLYLVTDRKRTRGRPLTEVVAAALRGGIEAVQVREKDLPTSDLLRLCLALRPLCRAHGAALLVNDRIDVAVAAGADGVHLPVDSFAPSDARRLLGPRAIIGASTHSEKEACVAVDGGADFIVFGPVFDTPEKRRFGPPVGLDALAAVVRRVSVPVLGIGGIDAQRAGPVRAAGARGVAVVSSILEAPDPARQARALRP